VVDGRGPRDLVGDGLDAVAVRIQEVADWIAGFLFRLEMVDGTRGGTLAYGPPCGSTPKVQYVSFGYRAVLSLLRPKWVVTHSSFR
jgi:hypothetical protein